MNGEIAITVIATGFPIAIQQGVAGVAAGEVSAAGEKSKARVNKSEEEDIPDFMSRLRKKK